MNNAVKKGDLVRFEEWICHVDELVDEDGVTWAELNPMLTHVYGFTRSIDVSKVEKLKEVDFWKLKKNDFKKAYLLIDCDAWGGKYNVLQRMYEISSDSNWYDSNKISKALYGYCLDGVDLGVRLDIYLWEGWKVERCFIVE